MQEFDDPLVEGALVVDVKGDAFGFSYITQLGELLSLLGAGFLDHYSFEPRFHESHAVVECEHLWQSDEGHSVSLIISLLVRHFADEVVVAHLVPIEV